MWMVQSPPKLNILTISFVFYILFFSAGVLFFVFFMKFIAAKRWSGGWKQLFMGGSVLWIVHIFVYFCAKKLF